MCLAKVSTPLFKSFTHFFLCQYCSVPKTFDWCCICKGTPTCRSASCFNIAIYNKTFLQLEETVEDQVEHVIDGDDHVTTVPLDGVTITQEVVDDEDEVK